MTPFVNCPAFGSGKGFEPSTFDFGGTPLGREADFEPILNDGSPPFPGGGI